MEWFHNLTGNMFRKNPAPATGAQVPTTGAQVPATGAQVPATGVVKVQGGGGSRRRRRGSRASRASRRKAIKGGSQGYICHNVGALRRAGGGKHRRCSKKNHTHCRHK